jgi:hypothetical protein
MLGHRHSWGVTAQHLLVMVLILAAADVRTGAIAEVRKNDVANRWIFG